MAKNKKAVDGVWEFVIALSVKCILALGLKFILFDNMPAVQQTVGYVISLNAAVMVLREYRVLLWMEVVI